MHTQSDEKKLNISLPVLGSIKAGQPTFSESAIIGEVNWSTEIKVKSASDYFALRVSGDSMIEDGIFEGNYVVVKNGTDFANGDIVIAYVNEEPTVKRIYRRGHDIVLQPANSAYDPIEVNLHHTPFRVGGQVIDVIRN